MPGWRAPHLLVGEGDVSRYVILTGDPERIPWFSSMLRDSRVVARNREFVVANGYYRDVMITLCSTGIGAPSAAIALEELYRCGSRVFIRVGSCGGLKKGLSVGDVVIPYAAVRLDGAGRRLAPIEYPAVANPFLYNILVESALKLGLKVEVGVIVSDDLFYGDQREYEYWARLGALAVEMESSIIMLYTSLKRGAAGAAILVVDGNILEGTGKAVKGAEKGVEHDTIVRSSLEKAFRVALEALCEASGRLTT